MSRFDHNSPDAKFIRIEAELALARVRDQRNMRHILKVMTRRHAEVMAALHPPPADGKKALLAFGQPAEKPSPAAGGQTPHPPPAGKPKEKTR